MESVSIQLDGVTFVVVLHFNIEWIFSPYPSLLEAALQVSR